MLRSQALETPQLGFRELNEPDLAWLRQPSPERVELGFAPRLPGTFSGTLLNLTRRLHQGTPELFWAEDPMSSRCWGKKDKDR